MFQSVERSYLRPIQLNGGAKLILKFSLNFCSYPLNRGMKTTIFHLPNPFLSSHFIGWIQKSLNVSEQFSLFDKLSVNNIFWVVNIDSILTWWLQFHWELRTKIVVSCTASFCFWCGQCSACQQSLDRIWCVRALSLNFFKTVSNFRLLHRSFSSLIGC